MDHSPYLSMSRDINDLRKLVNDYQMDGVRLKNPNTKLRVGSAPEVTISGVLSPLLTPVWPVFEAFPAQKKQKVS